MLDGPPNISPIVLHQQYKFMYENFVIATQHQVFLLLEAKGHTVSCLRFNSLRQMKYGSPNDEAIGGHALAEFGLGPSGLFEVTNSPWIKAQIIANRVHRFHSDALFKSCRHFIACFKDVMLEVTCDSFDETELSRAELTSLITQQVENLREEL